VTQAPIRGGGKATAEFRSPCIFIGYRPSDTDELDIRKQRPYAPEIVSEAHLAPAGGTK